jgi:protoporphyrinogen IX oxidase
MTYLWFKAFHLVGLVAWFAGLFYLPRLFVYHAEANDQPEPARTILQQQYQLMEKRLYHLIMNPAMVLTLVMAIAMLIIAPSLLKDTWLQVKIGLVGCLVVYHYYCGRLIKQMAVGHFRLNGQQFRWFNEVPTVFFVMIVLLAVFKNSLPTSAASWSVLAIAIAMAAIIQLYAKKRRQSQEQIAEKALSSSGNELGAEGSTL